MANLVAHATSHAERGCDGGKDGYHHLDDEFPRFSFEHSV